ncbi:RNA-binding protein 1-like isoform X2 [Macadamia integrifolia]|uniref:RNA-binding protein 1-like isoform X2 n=1 Tax=Macadamia integrifolia TaxID=60698 RepID=UPI001C5017AB|nr:RNA-binding protein 1-like isoform X2 [Macadamia integrifolia]
MADHYWRYGYGNQTNMSPVAGKRPRSVYEFPGSDEFPSYFPREDERGPPRVVINVETIGASYDRYLRQVRMPSYGREVTNSPMSGEIISHPVDDPHMMMNGGGMELGMAGKSQNMGFGHGRLEMPLPPGASNTLFVEGLPKDCTRREVSHIFRPFAGFKEVRIVTKKYKSRHSLVLCFVDFATPAQAARVIHALQGYKFDVHDQNSGNLRVEFAHHPDLRSVGGPCGKR